LDMGLRGGHFTRDEYDQVLGFLKDPDHWWQKTV
jgi:hypothetical protein